MHDAKSIRLSNSNVKFSILSTIVLILLSFFPAFSALGTVKIESATGVSNYTATDATSGTTTSGVFHIYGGLAGTTGGTSPSTTYDTCVLSTTQRLGSCNRAAISPDTLATINFTSTAGGYPIILPPTGQTSTTPITPVYSSGFISANGSGYITVRWSDLCQRLSTPTSCALTTNDTPSGTFSVGVSATQGALTASESTSLQVTIATVVDTSGQSTTGTLSTGDTGLNEFEVGNGDSKVVLRSLNGTGVPTGSHLTFQSVRLLWQEAADDQAGSISAAFTAITAASPNYRDLAIKTGTSGEITLTPARVTGLTNDKVYAFKVAMVDLAGNVGYYTADSADTVCTFTAQQGTSCHVGKPGEVVGVLSNDLNCFVATAAYGSQMAPQVEVLRNFRNRFLLVSKWGKSFVKTYYRHGPKLAKFISDNDFFRSVTRSFLWPIIAFAWLSLRTGLWPAMAMFALGLGLGAAIISVLSKAWRRRV